MKFKKKWLDVGDELGVEWERWANGQAWRLKRKKHFGDVEPKLAMEAASNAAARMGKAVLSVKDRHFPDKYIWVQFADNRIRAGQPCPCGSRRLLAIHPNFVRCPACGLMLLVQSSNDADEYESRPAFHLGNLTGVHLAWIERVEGQDTDTGLSRYRDVYRGYGDRDGVPVLVIAEFRVEEDETLGADQVFERVKRLDVLPLGRLSGIVDVSALRNGSHSGWDIVL